MEQLRANLSQEVDLDTEVDAISLFADTESLCLEDSDLLLSQPAAASSRPASPQLPPPPSPPPSLPAPIFKAPSAPQPVPHSSRRSTDHQLRRAILSSYPDTQPARPGFRASRPRPVVLMSQAQRHHLNRRGFHHHSTSNPAFGRERFNEHPQLYPPDPWNLPVSYHQPPPPPPPALPRQSPRELLAEQVKRAANIGDFGLAIRLLHSARETSISDSDLAQLAEEAAESGNLQAAIRALGLLQAPTITHLALLQDWASGCRPQRLKELASDAYQVFSRVLQDNPSSTDLMETFFSFFLPLECWPQIWHCLETMAQHGTVKIDTFIGCIEAVLDGRAAQFTQQAASLVASIAPEAVASGKVISPDLICRLWLHIAMQGESKNAELIDSHRDLVCRDQAVMEAFQQLLLDSIKKLDTTDFKPVCRILICTKNTDVLEKALLEALAANDQPALLLDQLCADFLIYFGPHHASGQFPCRIGLKLLIRLADSAKWPDAVACLDALQRHPQLDAPAAVANFGCDNFEVFDSTLDSCLRCDCLSSAVAMVTSTPAAPGPLGLSLPPPRPQGAQRRADLLLFLARACAERLLAAGAAAAFQGAAHLAKFLSAEWRRSSLSAAFATCLSALSIGAVSSRPDAEQTYRLMMEACNTQLGLQIPPTALRLLLLAVIRLSMRKHALALAHIGTQSGIYRAMSARGTIELNCDMAGEEIAAVLALTLRRLPAPLAISLLPLNPDGRDPEFVRLAGVQPLSSGCRASELNGDIIGCRLAALTRVAEACYKPTIAGRPAGLLARRPRFRLEPEGPSATLSADEVKDLMTGIND